MGIKRGSSNAAASASKSEDKKARYEAGLDLMQGLGFLDVDDSMLEQVIKEVKAPKPVQQQIDQFVLDISKYVKKCQFPKISSPSQLSNLPLKLPEQPSKFPGAKNPSCTSIGMLKTKSLVFPNAIGEIKVKLQFNKEAETEEGREGHHQISLCLLFNHLLECPLVNQESLKYMKPIYGDGVCIILRPAAKFGKHFQLVISLDKKDSLENVQDQIDSLVSQQPYHHAALGLEIWRRQVGLELPPGLLPCLLLHCDNVGVINSSMKSWQIIKKTWAMVSSTDLDQKQLILGIKDPVPAPDDTITSPLLCRDGHQPLFPSLTHSQWNALSQFAAKSINQNVEASLLKSLRPDAVYDKIYVISGNTNLSDLVRNLSRGLEARVTMLSLVGGDRSWREDPDGMTLEVGVRFDPDLHWKPSTLGPLANCDTAPEFRQFWGERSQLRRFQDGVVREVVVWGTEDTVTDVVTAVLARHHKGCHLQNQGDDLEVLLTGDGGLAARKVLDRLVPVLYGLDQLSLKVAGVASVGQQGRSSLVSDCQVLEVGGKVVKEEFGVAKLTSKAGMAARYVEPLDVVLVAEHSGKWPKDPEARRRVELAWLMEVGKCLTKKQPGLVTKVMGESLIVMMEDQVLRFTAGQSRSSLSEISSWLASIDSSLPAWSGCVRLAQRWLASHLMSSVPDIAVEVSVAVVLASLPLPPASPTPAFISWLHTLATHDWNTTILPHPSLADEAGQLDRSQLPPLAVLCPHSPSPCHWTQGVTWPELQRMVSLASKCLNTLGLRDTRCLDTFFSPNLECYDALIHLKPLQVPNRHLSVSNLIESKDKSKLIKNSENSQTIPIISHNCVSKYVSLLNTCYGTIAKFYYDKFGGTVIGVKIIESSSENKMKLSDVQGRMLSQDKVVTNWGAVTEDWSILGEGLVKNVEIFNTDIML